MQPNHTIALFPGAFRPPHAAHFAAVLDLANRADVDEVIVIIANRNRTLPGTTLVLDAQLAQQLWSIFLRATDRYPALTKVRTQIAVHSAIEHALTYLEEARTGDTYYFCIGESDFVQGDHRFATLAVRAAERGVHAHILPAPTGDIAVRATDLRRWLAVGPQALREFMAAMPSHLSPTEQHEVWHWCQHGLRDLALSLRTKIQRVVEDAGIATYPRLMAVHRDKVDPVFRLRQPDGTFLYIKYAGDTVGEGAIGKPYIAKPRRRLATERRALNYLHKTMSTNVVRLPEIVHFDKTTRTLVLSEAYPGGGSLQQALSHGIFATNVAGQVGKLLAQLHQATTPIRPFWGEEELDRAHWHTMLNWRTVQLGSEQESSKLCKQLAQLERRSDEARRPGFFHLDLVPKNLFFALNSHDEGRNDAAIAPALGLIDLELCANIGDPAYELGLLLGHYYFWGTVTNRTTQANRAMQALLSSYQGQCGTCELSLFARTKAFTGTTLLALLRNGPQVAAPMHRRLSHTATAFLCDEVAVA